MPNHEIKACPRCKKKFEYKTGNITQCQCFGISLSIEQKAYLEDRYEDCLCRNCMLRLQNEVAMFLEKYIFGNYG